MFYVEKTRGTLAAWTRDKSPVWIVPQPDGSYVVRWKKGPGDCVQRPRARKWSVPEAIGFARVKKIELRNDGAEVASMGYGLKVEAVRFGRTLRKLGVSWDEARACIELNLSGRRSHVTMGQLWAEFRENRERDLGVSKLYLRMVDFVGSGFLEHIWDGASVEAVTPAVLNGWFESNGFRAFAMGTRRAHRAVVRAAFGYAISKGYVDKNPVDATQRFRVIVPQPRIYSIDELGKILPTAERMDSRRLRLGRPSGCAVLASFLWTGIRQEEMKRIAKPGDPMRVFDLARSLVRLPGFSDGERITKTGRPKSIPIQENFAEWLSRYGLPVWWENWPAWFRRVCRAAGVSRLDNALRKSWVSYALAKFQNAPLVARWAGHSILVQAKDYEDLKDREDGEAYYELRPQPVGGAKVIAISAG